MFLTRLSLRNPILVLMMALGVTLLGQVSLSRLSLDLFPKIPVPVIMVGTLYPGASPRDVEMQISYPLEMAVSQSSGIDYVSSVSYQGFSVVRVWFRWGTDIDAAELQVSQWVSSALKNLPHGIWPPYVVPFDISMIPVGIVKIDGGNRLDEKALWDLTSTTIQPQLQGLPDISAAVVTGGLQRQIVVEADPDKLRERHMTIVDLQHAVHDENLLMASGDTRMGQRDVNVFTNSQIRSLAALGRSVIRVDPTGPVRIEDVATVKDGAAIQYNTVHVSHRVTAPDGTQHVEMERGLYVQMFKQPGSNTLDVVNAIKAACKPGALHDVPAGVTLTVTMDQGAYIETSMRSLKDEAVQGGLLALLVILLFLGDVRSTIVVGLAIPLSITLAFVLLYFTGETLNTFTLGGLSLAIGRLVDDAIVVLENVHRHLELGKTPLRASLDGATEVSLPVLSATLTLCIVLFPLTFLTGIAKYLFTPMAATIVYAMGASYFVAMMVVPALCRRLFKSRHASPEAEGAMAVDAVVAETEALGGHGGNAEVPARKGPLAWILSRSLRALARLDAQYEALLERALRRRKAVLGVVGACFGLSLLLVPHLGTEFYPQADESMFRVLLRGPIGQRLLSTEEVTREVEKDVGQVIPAKYIKNILANVGAPMGGASSFYSTNTGPHSSYLMVELVQPDERPESTFAYIAALRKKLAADFPGLVVSFDPGGVVKKVLNFGFLAPIDVEVRGQDLEDGAKLAMQVAETLQATPGCKDVLVSREEHFPEYDVDVDRQQAGLVGVSERDVASTVLASIVGDVSHSPIYSDPKTGVEYYIVTRLKGRANEDLDDIGNFALRGKDGNLVYLKSIANFRRGSQPVEIPRRNLARVIDVTANPEGRDLGSIARDLKERFAKLAMPPGFTLRFRGQVEEQAESFKGLALASLLALVLVYMVLAAQFKSFVHPFIIMFTVPLGMIGVFLALFLWHTTLSTTSMMGIIMMVGIVVSNGVLLVDYANQLRVQGMDVRAAIVKAGRTRLRPILMTSVATLVGLLPMALGLEAGSEANAPLARAVIGGLGLSTLLTLFVVPCLYYLFDGRKGAESLRPNEEEVEILGL